MFKKKIGIIVTVYNEEQYITECIESIINQSYRDLDIILVDDGSTDSSGRICDEYQEKDERIHTIHQKNLGLLMARYNGVKETNCEYVTFVDGDDWIELNAYETVAEVLKEDIDIVSFGIKRYFDSKNQKCVLNSVPQGMFSKKELDELIVPNMIWNIEKKQFGLEPSLCTKVMKRELVLNVLERAKSLGIYCGEDMAVTYPTIKKSQSIAILENYFYYHRQRKAGKLPSYISDEEFLGKLYKLYAFLLEQFKDQRECIKQIEYYYIYAVNVRKGVYGDLSNNEKYMFPFLSIRKKSKIVLYGAGSVGQTYYEQVKRTQYCDVIAWIDKNNQNYKRDDLGKISNIDVLSGLDFDCVVIAVQSPELAENIKRDLVDKDIPESKIVWNI